MKDAHRLLALGYVGLDSASQASTEEEEITESLANAIGDLIEAEGAPRWVDRYVVNDEIRLRHPTRKAKKRPRIDIQIVYVKGRPRPRFHFEAKRFGRTTTSGTTWAKRASAVF